MPVTSTALVREQTARPELAFGGQEAFDVPAPDALRTRLALALIVIVQVAWLAALGYAVLAFL